MLLKWNQDQKLPVLLPILAVITGCLAPEHQIEIKSTSSEKAMSAPEPTTTPTPTKTPSTFVPFSPSAPPVSPSTGGPPSGTMSAIDPSTGVTSGWAYDPENSALPVQVEMYVDGPAGTGTLLSKFSANAVAPGNPSFNHWYSFSIPSMYHDGKMHSLHGYLIDPIGMAKIPLENSPQSFFVGSTVSGLNYFNSTVKASLQSNCGGCHPGFSDYTTAKSYLASPGILSGSSSTNNTLYRKATGAAGHGGGSRCATNTAPCSLLPQWWNFEFGP